MKQDFSSNISGLLGKPILAVWLLLVVILLLATSARAQGGCPAIPDQAPGVEPVVIEALPLSPYLPEAPSTQLNRSFYENAIEFTFDPTTSRVLLAGSPDGRGQLCVDDLTLLESQDWHFKLDSRSADLDSIVTTDPIDISYMFSAGQNHLAVELVDLTPGYYSASPLWLVIVEASSPVTGATPTNTPRPTQTPTPEPTPTPWPTPTYTPVVSKTFTLEVAAAVDGSQVDPPNFSAGDKPFIEESTSAGNRFSLPWLGLMGAGLITLLVLGWRWKQSRPATPPGQVSLFAGPEFIQTWDLAAFGKAVVTLGGEEADIVLPTEEDSIPPLVARILAQATPDGDPKAVWELLDPDAPEVVLERQTLQHGDELLVFKNIRLDYSHYEAETETFLEGEFIHV
jgi:hypothetical protein